MNYKLAKQLKDAGFPQDRDNPREDAYLTTSPYEKPKGVKRVHVVYNPTLSELIDACDINFHLAKIESMNLETGWKYRAVTFENFYEGKTPEEAVAKLWLKLNEKRTDQNEKRTKKVDN